MNRLHKGTNETSAISTAQTQVWEPNAGRILFFITLSLVFVIQILTPLLQEFGINVPISATHTYIYGVAIIVLCHGYLSQGLRGTLVGFVLLLLVGFFMEGLGVNYGLIYGPYHYTDIQGTKIWGVPPIVPLSWQLNMYPAIYLALYLLPESLVTKTIGNGKKFISVLLFSTIAAIFCTYYDLIVDPVYLTLTDLWVWHRGGDLAPYAQGGIPFANYMGWIFTGIVGAILFYYAVLNRTVPSKRVKSNYLSVGIPLIIYAGAAIWPVYANYKFIHNEAIYLYAIFGVATVVLLVITKFLFKKFDLQDITS
jgi:uncharacterized membrane protein